MSLWTNVLVIFSGVVIIMTKWNWLKISEFPTGFDTGVIETKFVQLDYLSCLSRLSYLC